MIYTHASVIFSPWQHLKSSIVCINKHLYRTGNEIKVVVEVEVWWRHLASWTLVINGSVDGLLPTGVKPLYLNQYWPSETNPSQIQMDKLIFIAVDKMISDKIMTTVTISHMQGDNATYTGIATSKWCDKSTRTLWYIFVHIGETECAHKLLHWIFITDEIKSMEDLPTQPYCF